MVEASRTSLPVDSAADSSSVASCTVILSHWASSEAEHDSCPGPNLPRTRSAKASSEKAAAWITLRPDRRVRRRTWRPSGENCWAAARRSAGEIRAVPRDRL